MQRDQREEASSQTEEAGRSQGGEGEVRERRQARQTIKALISCCKDSL